MAPTAELSIPSATTVDDPSPHTVYHISLRLPLRSFTLSKRYSEFTTLDSQLKAEATLPPPLPLPPKSWLSRTINNPTLTEERRKGLESYIRAINSDSDSRWRNTTAWRAFLNLPNSTTLGGAASSSTTRAHTLLTEPGAPGISEIHDPTVWLDVHREVKSQLHDVRLHITRRDQATSTQKQHESSAAAKSCLVKTGQGISALVVGLKNISTPQGSKGSGWGDAAPIGEGELRRRKDLIASLRKEKDGLDNLLLAMDTKSKLDQTVSNINAANPNAGSMLSSYANSSSSSISTQPRSSRVLGKETAKTRELDNKGLLQMQREEMADQDLAVEDLLKIVRRQKELGLAINQELQVQNEMLAVVDEDVDRVQTKIGIATKRLGKIS